MNQNNLTTKYRPTCLRDVLGQPDVTRALALFVQNPYSGAFLFSGNSGTGKTAAAYALACELGCRPEEEEMGGIFNIPSGCQSTDDIRRLVHLLRYRPLMSARGWRVVIVNECDRMPLPVETIWLDALENLTPTTIFVFSTNETKRLSDRFRHRCEPHVFEGDSAKLAPAIRHMAITIWRAEGFQGDPPGLDTLGMPTLDGGDSMHASFRLAVRQLERIIREARWGADQQHQRQERLFV